MNSPLDLTSFDAAWRTKWPETRPIGHELRSSGHETWVRFHSLPESKRYAENEAEYDELLSRHFTLLKELSSSTSTQDLCVITTAWSESSERAERDPELVSAFPSGIYWRSEPFDLSEPNYPMLIHLYVGTTFLDSPDLRTLLRFVADDRTRNVIICPQSAEWLYHPYDGGGDVIAPNRPIRDALRERHADWLSALSHGL